jgi:Uma2 family endonuclease
MSENYEETIDGETTIRHGPDARHEQICERLHVSLFACVTKLESTRLLPPRSPVELSPGSLFRPDLALVATATNKPWLVAEVIDSRDHRPDTVTKKGIYEDLRLPRLWMVDPRYNNVEVYHGTRYGLSLLEILALREVLKEKLLPGFELRLADLFAEEVGAPNANGMGP